jgi:hypothetical protein
MNMADPQPKINFSYVIQKKKQSLELLVNRMKRIRDVVVRHHEFPTVVFDRVNVGIEMLEKMEILIAKLEAHDGDEDALIFDIEDLEKAIAIHLEDLESTLKLLEDEARRIREAQGA